MTKRAKEENGREPYLLTKERDDGHMQSDRLALAVG